ncbi:MAG: stage II sporulation protein M [Brevinema sp.]
MLYSYIQTLREYVFSIILSILLLVIIPAGSIDYIQQGFIFLLTRFPITSISILLVNLSTMLFILFCGLYHKEFVSFFVVLNGVALGVIFSLYQYDILTVLPFLFPHGLFETAMILIFCSEVKILSSAYKEHNNSMIRRSWCILIIVCVPLWLLAGILEGFFSPN